MAEGRKIDDHSSWVGKGPKGVVYPSGAKMKGESEANSAGHLNNYEDTTEKIKEAQNKGVAKIKAHPRKDDYRN